MLRIDASRMSATAVTAFSLCIGQTTVWVGAPKQTPTGESMMDRISKFLLLWLGRSTRQWLIQHLTGSEHPCAFYNSLRDDCSRNFENKSPLIRFEKEKNCWHFFFSFSKKNRKKMNVFISIVMLFLLHIRTSIGKLKKFIVSIVS